MLCRGAAGVGALALLVLLLVSGCRRSERTVILYTSQDQAFAEPVLAQFTQLTGIRVETVFDSEAVKTVGLANRLLAERNNPHCDVWWSNEELRTRQLEERGLFRETNGVAAFGSRSRRFVINTNKLNLASVPTSLAALTNAEWAGKVALAYPMFGTTSAHFIALRHQWGAAGWEAWCRALVANRPLLVDGNSVVVKLVGRGEAWIGLTDSDDIEAGQREQLPIVAASLGGDSFAIPNTVAVLRSTRQPDEAQALYEYLQSQSVINALQSAGALERGDAPAVQRAPLNWPSIVGSIEQTSGELKQLFLR